MSRISRRTFNRLAIATGAYVGTPNIARAAKPMVVVIGGGAGGATVARYLATQSNGSINITLVEPSKRYYTCFYSNLFLGGFRSYESLGHGYRNLAVNYGINIIHDMAIRIDRKNKHVALSSGAKVGYDKLVLSPGIDLQYDSVPGYTPETASLAPHAYKSGTQVQLLQAQVDAMKKSGLFVMVAPPNPFRCPPGPYERISMIAHRLKGKNPTAKIVILDMKEKFSKQALFQQGWNAHYPGMIEWIPASQFGRIENVDMGSLTFETELDTFKADAASIIPSQVAGQIAHVGDVVDESGWCPIKPATMQSRMDDDIYIIGDASIAAAMPKSAFAANSQAKVVVEQIYHALKETEAPQARYKNTCWSLIGVNDGIKIGASYKAGKESIEAIENFISKNSETSEQRQKTYKESIAWYAGITADIFG